jgi:hypothetical protein
VQETLRTGLNKKLCKVLSVKEALERFVREFGWSSRCAKVTARPGDKDQEPGRFAENRFFEPPAGAVSTNTGNAFFREFERGGPQKTIFAGDRTGKAPRARGRATSLESRVRALRLWTGRGAAFSVRSNRC